MASAHEIIRQIKEASTQRYLTNAQDSSQREASTDDPEIADYYRTRSAYYTRKANEIKATFDRMFETLYYVKLDLIVPRNLFHPGETPACPDLTSAEQYNLVRRGFELQPDGLGLFYFSPDELMKSAYHQFLGFFSIRGRQDEGLEQAQILMAQDLAEVSPLLLASLQAPSFRRPNSLGKCVDIIEQTKTFRKLHPEIMVGILNREPETLRVLYEERFHMPLPEITWRETQIATNSFNPEPLLPSDGGMMRIKLLPSEEDFIPIKAGEASLNLIEASIVARRIIERAPRQKGLDALGLSFKGGQWRDLKTLAERSSALQEQIRQDPHCLDRLFPKLVAISTEPEIAGYANNLVEGRLIVAGFSRVPRKSILNLLSEDLVLE